MKEILEEFCGYIEMLDLYRYILNVNYYLSFQIVDNKVICYIRTKEATIDIKVFTSEEKLKMFFKSLE